MGILKKWLSQTNSTPVPLIVEIERPRQLPPMDESIAESVVMLQNHPGFQYLLTKLKFQRSALLSVLSKQRQTSLTDVEFIQSGIAWCDWLENQLNAAIGFKTRPKPQPPFDQEAAAFAEISRQLEVLEEEKV